MRWLFIFCCRFSLGCNGNLSNFQGILGAQVWVLVDATLRLPRFGEAVSASDEEPKVTLTDIYQDGLSHSLSAVDAILLVTVSQQYM